MDFTPGIAACRAAAPVLPLPAALRRVGFAQGHVEVWCQWGVYLQLMNSNGRVMDIS
jgi:hypothetical protein